MRCGDTHGTRSPAGDHRRDCTEEDRLERPGYTRVLPTRTVRRGVGQDTIPSFLEAVVVPCEEVAR